MVPKLKGLYQAEHKPWSIKIHPFLCRHHNPFMMRKISATYWSLSTRNVLEFSSPKSYHEYEKVCTTMHIYQPRHYKRTSFIKNLWDKETVAYSTSGFIWHLWTETHTSIFKQETWLLLCPKIQLHISMHFVIQMNFVVANY